MSTTPKGLMLVDDVIDIDGKVVLKGGQRLTDEVLKSTAGGHAHKKLRYIEGTFIHEDARIIVRERNYREIFEKETEKEKVLDIIGKVAMTAPLRHEFEIMKRRSIHLYHHSLATAVIAMHIVSGKLVDDKDLDKIGLAMLLHDLGMTRIPIELMQNTDHLNKEEYQVIQSHAAIGAALINHYMGDGIGVTVAYRHHELKNKGYPMDAGKPSKIVDLASVVDIFNALISHRPFRLFSYDVRGAIDSLTELASQGKVEDAFVKLIAAAYRHSKDDVSKVKLSAKKLGFVPKDNYYGLGFSEQDE